MTSADIIGLITLNLIGMISPGPDIFLLIRLATKSRPHALAATLGIASGLTVWVIATVVGASTLLHAYPSIMGAIQLIGGLWLGFMAKNVLTSALAQYRKGTQLDIDHAARLGSLKYCYRLGLATNLSNPKVVLYFAAIIAPFLPPNPHIGQALLVVAVMIMTTVLGFSTLVMAFSARPVRHVFYRFSYIVDFIAGGFFAVASIGLIIAGLF
ncbi:LysE family translocator [Corynebacterium sp. ES2794-CONJ1]|uniref:LysE family translocator n=1 Tax=unclassified Corynebacterium TaxID=2624378 RepID=UPI00216A5E69|nr:MULTISPECIES: LysE family translocator [unclassified Corynebacterium]MCS4492302.1 LysE family translocator [Corynebacterium sp. ES2715-CONJ3]MCU9519901.1 LysE family translocator [Corynebacterium sp. ES2794-CONJ1]